MNIVITNNALNDLNHAFEWYQKEKMGLGLEFISSIRSQLKLIENFPFSSPKKFNNYHVSRVQKFPYLIYYKINKEIVISAILHTSRQSDNF